MLVSGHAKCLVGMTHARLKCCASSYVWESSATYGFCGHLYRFRRYDWPWTGVSSWACSKERVSALDMTKTNASLRQQRHTSMLGWLLFDVQWCLRPLVPALLVRVAADLSIQLGLLKGGGPSSGHEQDRVAGCVNENMVCDGEGQSNGAA